MNYITTIQKNKTSQIELAEQYATKFQNDFVIIQVDENFIMIRATRYIGMSFMNKVKRLSVSVK